MSYILLKAKGTDTNIRSEIELRKAIEATKIDRTETCFGGKGHLTEEQFKRGMELAAKMRRKTSW